jgi:hypothetical protein
LIEYQMFNINSFLKKNLIINIIFK